MTRVTDFGSWWEQAACQSSDPELFFPITERGRSGLQVSEAKTVCAGCRVRQQCLDYAIDTRQPHGIWGGLSEAERRLIAERVAS
jgi:WhiB family transcriptional regulator, redox-sensing transcriptional regulator